MNRRTKAKQSLDFRFKSRADISIYDTYELRGTWSTPEEPSTEIPGVLSHSPRLGTRLLLFGALVNPIRLFEPLANRDAKARGTVIYGRSSRGLYLTIHGATLVRTDEQSHQEFSVRYVLLSMTHHPSNSNFIEIRATYPYFHEWFGRDVFPPPNEPQAPIDNRKWRVEYRRPDDVEVRIAERGLRLQITSSVTKRGPFAGRVSLEHEDQIHLLSDKPEAFSYLWDQLDSVSTLISFALKKSIVPHQMELMENESFDNVAVIYAPPFRRPVRSELRIPFLFTLQEIDDLSVFINRWFAICTKFGVVINLLLSDFGEKKQFLESRFLQLAQAIEVFDRLAEPDCRYAGAEEYKLIQKNLVAAIPECCPPRLRSRLTSQLEHANEYSLRDKIRRQLECLPPKLQVRGSGPGAIGKTVHRIVHYRNYFTHFSGERLRGSGWVQEVFMLSSLLETMLVAGLLRESGFSSLDIERAFRMRSY